MNQSIPLQRTNLGKFSSKYHWIFVLVLSCAMGISAGCSRPPQMLTSDGQMFRELDNLYTAVNARRPELVRQSQERFESLHREKKLSDRAFQELRQICNLTTQSDWPKASAMLYRLMRAQKKPAKA